MTTATARKSLATLAILACVTLVSGAAFVAVTFAIWNWVSVAIACLVAVLLVFAIGLLLDVLDHWLDGADGHADEKDMGS